MMYPDKFKTEPSKKTPWIILEPGRIFIMGRSITENPGDFYRPVHKWISEYAEGHAERSRIDLGFEYINTSSTKWIFNILKELSELRELSENARVNWYYEQGDEDMCELGFILRSLIACPFFLVEVEEMNVAGYEKIISEPV
jgi:SiaC family regulatory phosphoprotein